MYMIPYIEIQWPCARLNETCSRFFEDNNECCWPLRCEQENMDKGVCVKCIKAGQFCVDDMECCELKCIMYNCQ